MLDNIMPGRFHVSLIKKNRIIKIVCRLKNIGKRKIIANLECLLLKIRKVSKNSFSNLFGNEIFAKQLSDSVFEALSLVNNHIFDLDVDGLINS